MKINMTKHQRKCLQPLLDRLDLPYEAGKTGAIFCQPHFTEEGTFMCHFRAEYVDAETAQKLRDILEEYALKQIEKEKK